VTGALDLLVVAAEGGDRLPSAAVEQESDQDTGDEKLGRRADAAAAVPAVHTVAGEELAAARPRKAQDVLEVRRRRRERPGHGWIERAAHAGEEKDRGDPGGDLEAAIADVPVRHSIPGEMKSEAEWHRGEPRADE